MLLKYINTVLGISEQHINIKIETEKQSKRDSGCAAMVFVLKELVIFWRGNSVLERHITYVLELQARRLPVSHQF